jgi:hypothetical protein
VFGSLSSNASPTPKKTTSIITSPRFNSSILNDYIHGISLMLKID